jgi:hypothetical protein
MRELTINTKYNKDFNHYEKTDLFSTALGIAQHTFGHESDHR